MRDKKNIVQIVFQILTTLFLATNIAIAAVTKECTLFSYVCCNIIAILQSFILTDMYWEEGKK